MAIVVYRGTYTPVFAITGLTPTYTFLKRAQSFGVTRRQEEQEVREIGVAEPVGTLSSYIGYRGDLASNEVGQGILSTLGLHGSWLHYCSDPAEVGLACLSHGLDAAVITQLSLESVVNKPAMLSIQLEGTEWTTYNGVTPALDASLPASVMHPSCNASIGTKIQRVQMQATNDATYIRELGNDNVVGWLITKTEVLCEVEVIHPGTLPRYDDETEAQDIVLDFGTYSVTVKDCISVEEPRQGSVRGWVTARQRYRSLTGNFVIN